MATPVSVPLVNGFRYSFASVEAKVAGQIFFILAINYSRTRSRPGREWTTVTIGFLDAIIGPSFPRHGTRAGTN